jgi:hypothetical protein
MEEQYYNTSKEIGCPGVNWTYLARDTDKRWTLVNTKINLYIRRTAKNFLTAKMLQRTVHRRTSLNMFYAANVILMSTDEGLNVTKICKTKPINEAYVLVGL